MINKWPSTDEAVMNNRKIVAWQDSASILQALMNNGIDIQALDQTRLEEVTNLAKKNEHRPGFISMVSDISSGERFKQCLDDKENMQCYLAIHNDGQKSTVAGFVIMVTDKEDNSFNISELGVDENYAHGDKKSLETKNIGSSLLLTACNTLFSQHDTCNQVGVLASDENAVNYYLKFHFEPIQSDEADDDELMLDRSQYDLLEQSVLARSSSQQANRMQPSTHHNRFFQPAPRREAENRPDAANIAIDETSNKNNPFNPRQSG